MKINKFQQDHIILFCLKDYTVDTENKQIIKLLQNFYDWGSLIKLSMYHEILPLLYKKFKNLNLLNYIPKMVLVTLENNYFTNIYRNTKLWGEFEHILDLTGKEKIKIIPFKGIILSRTIYEDSALRIFADIDLLIRDNDLHLLRKILINEGYKEIKERDAYVFKKLIAASLYAFFEVHTTFVPARPYVISFPQLWQRTKKCLIGNREIECLSNEDTFFSLALHLRRHTRDLSLKFIYDIRRLLNLNAHNFDWTYVDDLAKKNHFRNCIFFSLYICKELLGNSMNEEIMDKFRPSRWQERLIYFCLNKNNFLKQKLWRGYLLRFLLFDRIADFMLYLFRFQVRGINKL